MRKKGEEEQSETDGEKNIRKVKVLKLKQPNNLERTLQGGTRVRYLDMTTVLEGLWLEGQVSNRTTKLSTLKASGYKKNSTI